MTAPPSSEGAIHVRSISVWPSAVAVSPVGLPGMVDPLQSGRPALSRSFFATSCSALGMHPVKLFWET